MKTFYTLPGALCATLLFLFAWASPTKAAEDRSAGCLMIQTNIEDRMLMTQGVIGQTFTPCESGSLEHLSLFLESATTETFGAQLSIYSGNEELARQQFVVPSKGAEPRVQAWMAQPPVLEAGKEYQLRLQVPAGKPFYAYYSSLNTYTKGSLRINGMYMGGDLAFEAGVRLQHEITPVQTPQTNSQECLPVQDYAQETLAVNLIEGQTFVICERSGVNGIMLQYRSTTEVMGVAQLLIKGQEELGSVADFTFAVNASPFMTPLYLMPDTPVELDANVNYFLTFSALNNSNTLPDNFELYCSSENAYALGKLYSPVLDSSKDLAFQLDLLAAEAADKEVALYEFNGHPWHDCVISQPYWTAERTFTGPTTISLQVPVCDDGKVENVYLPGTLDAAQPIEYKLISSTDRVVASGDLANLESENGVLVADLQEKPVLFYFDYTLEIIVPEGASLTLHVNTLENDDLPTTVDGVQAEEGVAYAVGMRPYNLNFTAAEEDRLAPELTAYPNPFTDQFQVRIDALNGRSGHLALYNLQGTVLWEGTVASDLEQPVLNVQPNTTLQRGYYTLRFEYDDQVILQTVICQ